MNWLSWTTPRTAPDDCASLDPLLSLYADGMASPQEVRRVESHLPGCAECRQSLLWMQATRRALAARPVVPPPHDLRARIAEAIAASSAVRPVRSFVLRPAFAAAASLSVIGLLSYGLLHAPAPPETVHPQPPPKVVAVLPPKAVPAPAVRPTPLPTPLRHVLTTRRTDERVATAVPDEAPVAPVAVPLPVVAHGAGTVVAPRRSGVMPAAAPETRLPRLQKRTAPRPSVTLMAHRDVRPEASPAHHAPRPSPVPEPGRGPSVASSHIPDEIILPATIHNDPAPPSVQTASVDSHSHAPGLLDDVNKAVVRMRETGFVKRGSPFKGAAIAMPRIDSDSSPTFGCIYTQR